MNKRWRPYPEYKDSGVAWLGNIPVHWDIRKLKQTSSVTFSNVDKRTTKGEQPVRLCNYVDVYYNDYITADLEFMEATASPDEVNRFTLREADVIVTKDSESWDDIAVAAYVPSILEGVLCGYHLALIRPNVEVINGKYLFRSFCARGINDQFRVAATGITRYGLGKYWLDNSSFLVPPLPEQRAIAAFLDRETAKLDALAAKQEHLIELLQERRAALISHAVTHGPNPDVPMRDSGISWLGKIPAHWQIKRLKRISPNLSVGVVVTPSRYVDDEGNIPFLFGSDISEGYISIENARRITEDSNHILAKSMLRAGDLVTVRVGYPGVTAVVPSELDGCNCASIMIVRRSDGFLSQWLCYVMNSHVGKAQIEIVQYGAAQKQFNISHAVEFVYPVPPLEEQCTIAAHLDHETAKLDALIAKIQEAKARLSEYRAALISAAVTGKIDVRGET